MQIVLNSLHGSFTRPHKEVLDIKNYNLKLLEVYYKLYYALFYELHIKYIMW